VQFREHVLENGLTIIAECNPDAYSTALGYFVDAGARDESDETSGVSHFLEHMLFKGTSKRSAWEVNRDLDSMGSQSNASTNQERTVYYAAVLPEFQDPMVELLSDLMRPALREEDFDVEKDVIIEEIQTSADQPPYGGYEKSLELYYRQHPLSRSVLGTVESIKALKVEQMREYFQQRYSPQNLTLAASGNVDFDALIAKAEACCGDWAPFASTRDLTRSTAGSGVEVMVKDDSSQEYVMQLAAGPSATDDDRIAARLLATILGDDSGSRFYWEMIDTGLAEYLDVSCHEYQGDGLLATFLCCAPDQAADNLERIHRIELAAQTDGVREEELVQARNKICSHVALSSERPLNRLFALGVSWLQRHQYRPLSETIGSYTKVTVKDIHAVLEKYPLTENVTVAVGPLKSLKS